MAVAASQPSYATISCLSGCDGKVDSSLRLHRHFDHNIDAIPCVNGTPSVMTQHVGQHRLHLQHSELLSNAVPGTGAEGDVGIRVSLCYPLWQEVVRVELLRVWELGRISMDSADVHGHCASRRDVIARWKSEQNVLLSVSWPLQIANSYSCRKKCVQIVWKYSNNCRHYCNENS